MNGSFLFFIGTFSRSFWLLTPSTKLSLANKQELVQFSSLWFSLVLFGTAYACVGDGLYDLLNSIVQYDLVLLIN